MTSFFTVEAWIRFDTSFTGSDNRVMYLYEKYNAGASEAKLSVGLSDRLLVANIGGKNGLDVEQLIDWSTSSNVWRYVAVTF